MVHGRNNKNWNPASERSCGKGGYRGIINTMSDLPESICCAGSDQKEICIAAVTAGCYMLHHTRQTGDHRPGGCIGEPIRMDDPGCRLAHDDLDSSPFAPELMDEFYNLNRSDTSSNANNQLLSLKRLHFCHIIITS
jgi:hypothetical protein